MSLRHRLQRLRGTPSSIPDGAALPRVDGNTRTDADADADASEIPAADVVTGAAAAPGSSAPAGIVNLPRTQAPHSFNAHGPEALLPGAEHITPFGACYVAEWRYPLAHQHGSAFLGDSLAAPRTEATLLLARGAPERVHLQRANVRGFVYLDTETTGLAGGTGTYAFLVGIGRFIGAEFVVRQIFMRTLAEEYAALHLLQGMLADCEVLVTYNGKAFDWPLIETRYALARRGGPPQPSAPGAHVDLLFAARRLWRARLESCTLGRVEQMLLGVRRGDDTPGWLIPQLYFRYLRDRDARPLAGVFQHNALDILSLAALLGRVGAMEAPPRARDGAPAPEAAQRDAPRERDMPADELLALGRCFEEEADLARALACYQTAIQGHGLPTGGLRARIVHEARMRVGAVLKRQCRGGEALCYWEAALAEHARAGVDDIRPYEELAKYYEHALRDRAGARGYVLRALAVLDERLGLRDEVRVRARLLHRLRRLDASM